MNGCGGASGTDHALPFQAANADAPWPGPKTSPWRRSVLSGPPLIGAPLAVSVHAVPFHDQSRAAWSRRITLRFTGSKAAVIMSVAAVVLRSCRVAPRHSQVFVAENELLSTTTVT